MIKKLKALKDRRWFSILTNSYVLVLTVFVIWMFFFDTNSILIQWELRREIKDLESQKEYLKKEIAKDSATIKMMSSKEALEKFARENYYYQKEGEDVFVIEFADSISKKDND